MALGSVAVFGATAEPGAELCRLLSVEGRRVVAISTGEGDISALAPLDLEIRTTDAAQQLAVKTALKEIAALEAVISFVNQGGACDVIDAALAAGARRFVLVTSIGGGESAKALSLMKRIARRKKLKKMTQAENHLRRAKLSWTILRTGPYTVRKPSGNGILSESPFAYGAINAKDLSRALYEVMKDDKTVGKVFSAMDAKHAKMRDGSSVTPFHIS